VRRADMKVMAIADELVTAAERLAAVTPQVERIAAARFALADELKQWLGYHPVFKVSTSGKYVYFDDDIGHSAMGVFAAVFKEASVRVVVEEEQLKGGTYAQIEMKWTHHNGGTNGANLGWAWLNTDTGSWTLKKA
jgi:hypothetical protein